MILTLETDVSVSRLLADTDNKEISLCTSLSGTDLAGGGGVWGATPPSISVPFGNFVSFGKNHLLVVSSNKANPKFYFLIFLSVFIFLKVA